MNNGSLRGRSLLTLTDFTPQEITLMLEVSHDLKRQKRIGQPHEIHKGKNIALLFEKTSTRTRSAFVVAAHDLGVNAEYLGKDDIQLGKKESVEDTAKVLGRMFDGIEFRGFAHETVEKLAEFSGVPVWNGLTDKFHPTQMLADFMTMQEYVGNDLRGVKITYVGDGRNNTANTLLLACAQMGLDFRILSPNELRPEGELVEQAHQFAAKSGAKITITDNFDEALIGTQFIYTDIWASMGEEDQLADRINLLRNYQVNRAMLDHTGNSEVRFMHCLPSFHNLNTETGRKVHEQFGLTEMEVTDEVFNSSNSIVFDEAENRLHTIKAVLALTL